MRRADRRWEHRRVGGTAGSAAFQFNTLITGGKIFFPQNKLVDEFLIQCIDLLLGFLYFASAPTIVLLS